jgi:hypothetical protein
MQHNTPPEDVSATSIGTAFKDGKASEGAQAEAPDQHIHPR